MQTNLASGHGLRDTADRRERAIAPIAIACALMVVTLGGCYKRSVLPQSEGHITTPAAKPSLDNVPPPARVSSFVPPPKPAVKAPTYSVVVNEVPVKELLLALVRDTKQNIDIHPALQGLVSLNAINETLPAILERISNQVNLRYRIEGNTMIVSPDTAYMKTYRVNYVNITRETTSTIGVSAQIGGVASGGTSGASAGGAQTNTSSTVVKTVSNNNFWDSLRDNIRAIINSTRQQNQTAEARAARNELIKQEQELKVKQMEAASKAGQGAAPLANSMMAPSASSPLQVSLLPDDVVVNPMSGTLTVNATEKQHQLVQQHIDSIVQISQRQVLIEATIAEISLSDQYQAGVDWSRLAVSGGITFQQSLLAGALGTPPSFAIGYTNPNSPIGNIAAAVKLLNQFGNTRVLLSPKVMALNNQTALLKVVDNIVYFHVQAQPAIVLSGSAAATLPTFTTTAETVPVGVVLSLTPQINENGQVTLTVRPTISRVLRFVNDPNPSLAFAGVVSPVPEIRTREMESVLQLTSGQTAILGGLMQDDTQYNRNSVPGAGNPANTGIFSELFGFRTDQVTKTELVIFLRPTVITNPSLDSDELKFFQRLLPQQTDTPTETVPGGRAGAAR